MDIPTACVTPCAIQAKRNADIVVTISKDGYRPQIIPLTKDSGSGGAGFAGNLLLGGDVGMGVDAVLDHKPNPTPRPPRPPRRRERPVS